MAGMILIQVGRRRLNLWYLVMDEESAGPIETPDIPLGGIRVTMEQGREFCLVGGDADSYRRQVVPYVQPDPTAGEPARSTSPMSREVNAGGQSPSGARRRRKRS